MKQAVFVRLNKEKWQSYEQKLNSDATPAEELSKIYVHLTEDLAFARSRYPSSDINLYLNRLSLKVHNIIYRNKPEERGRFFRFWKQEVPLAMATSAKPMLYSFLILLAGMILGWISSANDDTFVRLILGDAYVDMTLENIKNGNPMGVYGSMDQISMFFYITQNNIRVSFLAFIAGIFTSFVVGMILFRNGIMLGAFHYLFFENNLFDHTILTIWLHGTIEITSIVIAGGAGLILGNGLLFPGSYPRMHSVKKAAKKALKIIIGLVPFFIVAGFIESFVTRYSDMHIGLKLLIIIASALLMIYYFVLLPRKVKSIHE